MRFGGALWGPEKQARSRVPALASLVSPVQPLRTRVFSVNTAAPPPDPPLSTHRQPRLVSCCPAHRMTHPVGRLVCADVVCGRFMRWRRYPWLASFRSLWAPPWHPIFSLVSPPPHGHDLCFCLSSTAFRCRPGWPPAGVTVRFPPPGATAVITQCLHFSLLMDPRVP